MNTLRLYLNSLPPQAQSAYAARCQTTIGYLRKALSKGHSLGGALCRRLDEESGGRVRRGALRPDIWPELAEPAPHAGEDRRSGQDRRDGERRESDAS